MFIPSIGRVTSSKLFPSTITVQITGVQPWRVQGHTCGFASFGWKQRSQTVFKERNCAEITRLKLRRQRNRDEEFSSCSGDSYRHQRRELQLQGPPFDESRIIRGRAEDWLGAEFPSDSENSRVVDFTPMHGLLPVRRLRQWRKRSAAF